MLKQLPSRRLRPLGMRSSVQCVRRVRCSDRRRRGEQSRETGEELQSTHSSVGCKYSCVVTFLSLSHEPDPLDLYCDRLCWRDRLGSTVFRRERWTIAARARIAAWDQSVRGLRSTAFAWDQWDRCAPVQAGPAREGDEVDYWQLGLLKSVNRARSRRPPRR